MASRLLDRLKRSLFKEGQVAGAETARNEQEGEGPEEERWEAELAEEEECVTERLGGTLCFDGGVEEVGEGEGSGVDSDSDFLGESMEEGLSSTDTSPVGVSSPGPSPSVTRLLQESWRSLRGGVMPSPTSRGQADGLLFEVTDASVVQDGSSKYVLYTIHVIEAGGSDKTPAVITRRYSDFQRLHATLRRIHGDQMQHVFFPRKKLRRNFTAETIAKRSRAFEQYLSHLCSLAVLRGALCVRHFFYLSDLRTGQLLIRVGRDQEALGPLLNAKRLQLKLGWTRPQTRPSAFSNWFFTLVALASCFQEVEQLEEAQEHCDHALRHLTSPATPPVISQTDTMSVDKPHPLDDRPRPLDDKPRPLEDDPPLRATPPLPCTDDLCQLNENPSLLDQKPHPLLVQLLRAVVRLSWQTGKDKRQWEVLLQQLEEQWAGPDNQPTIKEFLVKHDLNETEGEG